MARTYESRVYEPVTERTVRKAMIWRQTRRISEKCALAIVIILAAAMILAI